MKKLLVLTLLAVAITACGSGNEQSLKEKPAKVVEAAKLQPSSGYMLMAVG